MKKWFRRNKKIGLFLLLIFLIWRVCLQIILLLGFSFYPPKPREDFWGVADKFFLNPLLWAWANFDGEHYLAIASSGYRNFLQAFFPFYPFLIRLFEHLTGDFLVSGLLVSHLSFLGALFIFYKLVVLDFEEKISKISLIYLLVFPTSFFFASVYTESLFLVLILASFYAARSGRWWIAGILGALTSATRFVGIFLFPALLWEWWEQNKNNLKLRIEDLKFLKNLLPIFLAPMGLLWYMYYLAVNYHDPLMFFHVQPAFGAQRVVDRIILLHQVFWRYLKMILTTKLDPLYFTVWLEFLTAIVFLGLLIFAYFKKIRLSYLIFAVFAYITPTLTGTFSSMPRYVLVLFPCFISLALIKNKIFRLLFLAISCSLLAISTIFFGFSYFIG